VLGARGAPDFEQFAQQSYRAYNILRRDSGLLMTLFSLMLGCGIHELQTKKDLDWLTETLIPDASEEEAAQRFKVLIDKAINTRATRVNNAVHLLRVADL
jgi:phosphatidylinositol-4,5-bisphosphate 3-kinase